MKKVLIIDDNRDIHTVLEGLLSSNKNLSFFHAYNGMEGYQKLQQIEPDLAILDNQMPVMSGFELLEKLQRENKKFPIIMLTAFGQISDAVQAIKLGAIDYLTKPFNDEQFNLIINKALKIGSLKIKSKQVNNYNSVQQANHTKYNIIGESRVFKELLKNAQLVAPTDITVIVNGSNGTGKEEIAKYIHYNSERSNRPFIAIDCGAIPENLFEREMFGAVKGAYTGADSDSTGFFEAANGGTIFMDEIGNLPTSAQSSLLRVLQNKVFRRVGGLEELTADVRLISATNAKLLDEVSKGHFREDLFHRINGFDLTIPDLKDRKEDIPLLVNYFITKFNAELKRNVQQISPEASEILKNHAWTGNIRELINTIQKAVLLCSNSTLKPKHLNITPSEEIKDFKKESDFINDIINKPISIAKKIEIFEKEVIKRAVEENNGNKTSTANWLKISRKTLYEKLKKFGLFGE